MAMLCSWREVLYAIYDYCSGLIHGCDLVLFSYLEPAEYASITDSPTLVLGIPAKRGAEKPSSDSSIFCLRIDITIIDI